ncbi:MAG: hypothetical protein FD180_250 [Planctomycetota bacterium]|nr:MAG: hypothetical protein FD180_250 [Planctomycetota bacterium]
MRASIVPAALLVVAFSTLKLSAADPADAKALRGTLKDEAADSLGANGARAFRSAAEWNAFLDRLVALGWKKPADDPAVVNDFSKNMVACVFQYGDDWNKFAVRKAASDGKQGDLEIGLSFPIQKSGLEHDQEWHFICVPLPQAPRLKVSVLVYHPENGGPCATLETANLDWSANLDDAAGDVINGLRGEIRPAAATVKSGDDILLDFTLRFEVAFVGKVTHFASPASSALVWDGKYSNGYRNHGFLVTTPDGKTHFLRRAVQDAWDKNAPHLVEVTHEKPYILPEWREGETAKSLKKLGLDTTAPGIYRITGVYAESKDSSDHPEAGGRQDWRGELFTNTVKVEVR